MLLQTGLNFRDELHWATKEIVCIHVLHQTGQKCTGYTAFAIVFYSEFVFYAGLAIGNMQINIGAVIYKLKNFSGKG